ncbi:hypothetical protein GCM10009798_13330 [Nocardioides panacihumi]|uniref:APC family permease n=1 Tax=Nocardioides panacihumi TaxID=400774 RepID=A0ABP5C3G7_9ACTN
MSFHDTTADTHQYPKTLRWWDGWVISLSIPAILFVLIGSAVGSLGAWTAAALLGIVAVAGCLQNYIYSELAGMFKDKVGGISMYAHQGWRTRLSVVGPLATYGYWFAWSSALSVYGIQIGALVKAQWFEGQTWTVHIGWVDFGFEHAVALGVLLITWGANVLGMRLAMWVMYVAGALTLIPVMIFALAPLLSSDWSLSNLTWNLSASGFPEWKTALAWMFVLAWSVYGIEAVASFVPEFRDTARDTRIALRMAGLFVVAVYLLVPFGIGGLVTQKEAATDPVTIYVGAFERIVPGGSWMVSVCVIAGLFMIMLATTADGGRALHGSAISGLSVKQMTKLNRFGAPGVAMSLDMVVNALLIVFVGSSLAVIVAGVTGYLLAHILALTGFLLLRRDFPDVTRPIKLGRKWTWIAVVLATFDIALLVVGTVSTGITGYGSIVDALIGFAILGTSLVLFYFRRVHQDKQKWVWRVPRSAVLAELAYSPVLQDTANPAGTPEPAAS